MNCGGVTGWRPARRTLWWSARSGQQVPWFSGFVRLRGGEARRPVTCFTRCGSRATGPCWCSAPTAVRTSSPFLVVLCPGARASLRGKLRFGFVASTKGSIPLGRRSPMGSPRLSAWPPRATRAPTWHDDYPWLCMQATAPQEHAQLPTARSGQAVRTLQEGTTGRRATAKTTPNPVLATVRDVLCRFCSASLRFASQRRRTERRKPVGCLLNPRR